MKSSIKNPAAAPPRWLPERGGLGHGHGRRRGLALALEMKMGFGMRVDRREGGGVRRRGVARDKGVERGTTEGRAEKKANAMLAEWLPCLPNWLTNQWTVQNEWLNEWINERMSAPLQLAAFANSPSLGIYWTWPKRQSSHSPTQCPFPSGPSQDEHTMEVSFSKSAATLLSVSFGQAILFDVVLLMVMKSGPTIEYI